MSLQDLILIVEDEPLIAMAVEAVIQDAGYLTVVCGTIEAATTIIETTPLFGAVLDFQLRKERSSGLADLLRRRHVPFVVATGIDAKGAGEAFPETPILFKPYVDADLLANLQAFEELQGQLAQARP